MEKKLKYPVVYAPLKINEQFGWDFYGDPKCKHICDVAAKCYLLNERKIYNEDGTSTKKYEVVFLRKSNIIDTLSKPLEEVETVTPKFNSIECYNSVIVYNISKNIDNIKIICDKANEKMFSSFSSEDLMANKKEQIIEKINHYYDILQPYRINKLEDPLIIGITDDEDMSINRLNTIKIKQK